jgi:hypothetical protein
MFKPSPNTSDKIKLQFRLAYKFLVKILKGRGYLGDPDIPGKVMLNWNLTSMV